MRFLLANIRIYLLLFSTFISYSQQNLFNVPSSEITSEKGTFFQQQLNISKSSVVSNTTIDFGCKNNFEFGFNLLNAEYDFYKGGFLSTVSSDGGALKPMMLLNAQKTWNINSFLRIGLGTQIGTSIPTIGYRQKISNFTYSNLVITPFEEKVNFVFGLYYGNKSFLGYKDTAGIMSGFDLKITNKFHLMGDVISGNHTLGVGVLGGVFYPKKNMPLSFGWQIPNVNSNNTSAFVFEFTLIPK